MRLHELETRAIGMLQHAAPRMLLIDEIQHLLSCGLRDQRAALNAIKFLANKLRISIAAAGNHEALHVMRGPSDCCARRPKQREVNLTGSPSKITAEVSNLGQLSISMARPETSASLTEGVLLSAKYPGGIARDVRRPVAPPFPRSPAYSGFLARR